MAVGAAGSGTEANALRDGNVDAAFLTAGIPTAAVRDLASQRDVVVLPIPADVTTRLTAKHPFYTKVTIPPDTYPKQGGGVDTVAVNAMLICQASLDEQTVYETTRALFTNLDRLILAHAKGKEIRKETARDGMPIPMHPGADRYLKGRYGAYPHRGGTPGDALARPADRRRRAPRSGRGRGGGAGLPFDEPGARVTIEGDRIVMRDLDRRFGSITVRPLP